mmetsp:Transcript_12441/g.30574  ORF Transcript_12441/g.30574 Transcript_12441/m.30574 type:complete len:572 (-) Transcript_12441:347-2062(-)|eukprot:CAMPEP_0202877072 /NCGR_PEP_ID=MMETSP1391-20130828/30051_1 /ASSEMBLY_ACC=CAM_ASM_000867 /TAXON_ID=1034604 /ORGANISM="Chlamydomonas leiostraca, Strain SAG 11-49" /LENGTH=571 /DNA_ID=CAMNT_0049559039 /DNA_START=100 /DNA_END=1815 /DNA_ORIENTATION=+
MATIRDACNIAYQYMETYAKEFLDYAQPRVMDLHMQLEAWLAKFSHVEVAAGAVMLGIMLVVLLMGIARMVDQVQQDGGLLRVIFQFVRSLPGVKGKVQAEMAKARKEVRASMKTVGPAVKALPAKGWEPAKVLAELRSRAGHDVQVADGNSHLSGAIYIPHRAHRDMLDTAYTLFSATNPLHADAFPSVRQMEAEVVAMTAAMLGGGPDGACPTVCGAMTSGGTESILLAMKAARDYARAVRGVRRPELVIAKSAHAAYFKASEYFGMKLVVLPVDKHLRLTGDAVARAINSNTAVVVVSAPGFPHGVVDDVIGIARVCRTYGCWVHVDACLGGFVLPWVRALGRPVPPFDFALKGVYSMSVDTHKFGLAHKGSSVVLYAEPALRQHQYTSITDWSGGLYISPTMAGSRPGALIATAWGALMSQGVEGYMAVTRDLMAATDKFVAGVNATPELTVLGKPHMCLVAFGPRPGSPLNIYKLNDLLTRKGWHLNALQAPPALHFCFTAAHVAGGRDVVEPLLADMRAGVAQLLADPDCVQGGSAPMYGMANVTPDRGLVGEFLVTYQDCMLEA